MEGARVHHPLERRGLLLHRRREAVLHERLADRVDRRVEARLALEAAARPVRHKRHKLVPDLVRHQAAVAPREPIVDHIGVRERCRRAVPGAVSRNGSAVVLRAEDNDEAAEASQVDASVAQEAAIAPP